ncbi:hypothetical protein FOH24_14400 [Acetobacter tropicalis]|uniref:Phage DNA invertase n=1 Tax=Acetobacter tropicalis TaxID=104102 RepID=A0A094YL39_9PROT|nr:hypothetical protein [Acetobacter tropicalis]KAA8385925.1 hypothetical protein FOH22_12425 [Acetobacter tropicalis]KAA8387023.1 hypothetical protein FOH24_14400 [Acetobacter tropicalis]KGB22067.1 Phage DNA invertase [Acetobacter tropicalis]MBC9009578.1 hypothetical protein [Acetobacter tropicalis]
MSDTMNPIHNLASVIDYLERTKDIVREHAPDVAQRFERLKERVSQDPEDNPYLRNDVAYAVQDFFCDGVDGSQRHRDVPR